MTTANLTLVGTYDGTDLYLEPSGKFKAVDKTTGKWVTSPSLAALKKALDKSKTVTPVTLLGFRGSTPKEVTVTGMGKTNRRSYGPREWDGCGEMRLYAHDPQLATEMQAAESRQAEEWSEMRNRHAEENDALKSRLIPLTDDQVKELLHGADMAEVVAKAKAAQEAKAPKKEIAL